MYRERQERQPVTEGLEGPQSPDQSSIAPRIYPALRSVTSAPDLEARSEPKRPSRTDPREMPVEIAERETQFAMAIATVGWLPPERSGSGSAGDVTGSEPLRPNSIGPDTIRTCRED